jgi:hypothetical protein
MIKTAHSLHYIKGVLPNVPFVKITGKIKSARPVGFEPTRVAPTH